MPDTNLVLVKELKAKNGSKIGHITLNSEETLNSLTLSMVDIIHSQLSEWEKEKNIVAVILEGAGDKAFCAGGDIRALYESMVQNPRGPNPFAEAFFEREYRLDYKIHKYSKPIICWVDGITMGGGVGLMLGCDYRFSTERTRFAMPEIGVGLFPDVGFTYFIDTLPKNIGLYMMLTATQLNAADTQLVGLTNNYISVTAKDSFEKEITELDWSDDLQKNSDILNLCIKNFKEKPLSKEGFPESQLESRLESVQALMSADNLIDVTKNILTNSTQDEWFKRGIKGLVNGCPTSAHIIWEQCNFEKSKNLKEVFKFELDLAIQITRHPDFTEGIRAVIIEKDNQPQWSYAEINKLPREWIEEHLEPAWNKNPLDDLEN
ncbi:MAG TPA: enoyl-CoA hydratase/isomerase family protein [Gammaproteobacteria bacterium]|nr:enoyl-CoA hydratase/isomerase family protein [Gammaproteobacteria bacterium]